MRICDSIVRRVPGGEREVTVGFEGGASQEDVEGRGWTRACACLEEARMSDWREALDAVVRYVKKL